MIPAIQVQNVSKYYRIGAKESGKTFREAMTDTFAAPFRRLRSFGQSSHREEDAIWALKDVSFEVMPGEVVGIIGRNGAGKSTLLKILSRITDPTEGRAIMNGRVASLLEVGTGFHPELTGRENIYLSGAILGMSRAEINRKFDEIVDFSGIEKFIDTPVKRYSSGMAVRLGFAVAAHLEPEILIVDEVLAVGDAEFQKKCLGKMQDVATGEGRTVLFVSHNMAAVLSLCRRALLLHQGKMKEDNTSEAAISLYNESATVLAQKVLAERTERKGKGRSRLTDISVSSSRNTAANTLRCGEPTIFSFNVDKLLPDLRLTFTIYDSLGQPVATFNSSNQSREDEFRAGSKKLICICDEILLAPGIYTINTSLSSGCEIEDHVDSAVQFQVHSGLVRGRITSNSSWQRFCLPHRWILPT